MVEHRGISVAEKRAELKETGASWPRCSCHGLDMAWSKHIRGPLGGYWRCREDQRQYFSRSRKANPEKFRARVRRWEETNPEKKAAGNARRIMAGSTYLGMCGFNQTEVEMMLSGTSE